MHKKKFSLIGVLLLAVLLFSAESALALTVPGLRLFNNPYPDTKFSYIEKLDEQEVLVLKGGKIFVGMFGLDYDQGRLPLKCQFRIRLVGVETSITNPTSEQTPSASDVKITDMNGNELPYTSGTGGYDSPYKTIMLPSTDERMDLMIMEGSSPKYTPVENQNYCQVFFDMTDAKPNATYTFSITLLYYRSYSQPGENSYNDIKLKCVSAPGDKPSIDAPRTITIEQGGIGQATFTGKNVATWLGSWNDIKIDGQVSTTGIEYIHSEVLESGNACRFTVKLNTNIKEKSAIEIPIRALNKYGYEATSTLTVNVQPDENHKEPTIDGDKSIEIVAGGTGTATFTGQHIKQWGYLYTGLPSFVDSVRRVDDRSNPNLVEYLVTVKDETASVNQEGDIKIYAYNGAGRAVTTPANLHVTVTAGEKYAAPTIDEDESVNVIKGGTVTAVFTGQHTRRWGFEEEVSPDIVSKIELDYNQSPARCEVKITAAEDAPDGPYTVNIYAYNGAGQPSEPKKLTINVSKNEAHETAVIDEDESVSVTHGGSATVMFTGSHARTWGTDEILPSWIDGLYLNYKGNPNNCKVTVTTTSDRSVKAGTEAKINIYAFNGVGQRSEPKTLTVTLVNDADHEDPVIDGDESVTVVQGGTAKAVFTGKYVRSWGYATLPDAVKDVTMNYETNPNRCEVLVTASSTAEAGDCEVTIYAYNAVGERTSAKLTVTVTEDTSHPDPVIDENESVTVIAGGTAKAIFTGEHIRSWNYGNLPDEVKAIKLDYEAHPNRCEVLVTASSTAEAGNTSVKIYAYNEIGETTSANLNITITEDTSHPNPVIDDNESVTVVAGGTARAVFTGQHIRSWSYGNLPDSVKAIDLNYDVNPDRCEVLVTASSTAEAGSDTVTIYAYNEIGESTQRTLTVTIVTDGSTHDDPVIDDDKTVTVIPGGTAKTVFTGSHVRAWGYGNLPDSVKAVVLNYEANPNRCEVLVTAASSAKAGNATITIYAYNEIGEAKSATLTVTITEDTSLPAPSIDGNESVSVIPGGTSSAVFTGQNAASWAYGNLPDEIKAIELRYDSNPNICEMLITASSTAEIGSESSVTIYAYNSVGMSADATLNVSVIDDSGTADVPEFTIKPVSADVVPGGSAVSVFKANNVNYWRHDGNLPSIVKAVEFRYNPENPGECEVIVTASSNAKVGDTATIKIFAGNVYDEAEADITITIASESVAAPVINEKTASITVAPGKSAKTTFTGSNISTWKYGNLPDGITAFEFVYDTDNPNTCEVTVTASSLADEGDGGDITITAYNSVGASADATLTVTIGEGGDDGDYDPDLPNFLRRHSSGCDVGFTGLSLLALSMMFFKSRSKK